MDTKGNLLQSSMNNIGWQGRFIICDTESTGFQPNDRYSFLIQISAVSLDQGTWERMVFDRYIKPPVPIPRKIRELTGITNETVRNSPDWEMVLQQFKDFCGKDSVLVFHNAPHDMEFLEFFGSKTGIHFMQYPAVDTYVLAKHIWPNQREKGFYKLENLAKLLGIDDPNHHNALNDVLVTEQLLKKEIELLNPDPCDRECLIPYHTEPERYYRLLKLNLWEKQKEGAELKKRLYVILQTPAASGFGTDYANVYYDFGKKQWGQQNGSFKVRQFEKIQDQILDLLAIREMDWDSIKMKIR